VLDMAVELVKKCGDTHILIEGHTCNIGSDEYNMKLGMRRAEATKAYLVANGISADILETNSLGESTPKFPNDSKESRARNRRIEFKVIR
jgi:OOP family OmpA-OmpF porin